MKKIVNAYFYLSLLAFLLCFVSCSSDSGNDDSSDNKTDSTSIEVTGKSLVAVFSCTGTTEKIAGFVADSTGGTLFKIAAKIPYTADDLNYNNSNSRTSKENADATARPEIENTVDGFASYDTIFIGYPIWHGKAPKIIYTFLESYDFTGKTIIPFCTSASSGIGSSDTNLHSLAPKANWKSGRRFSSSTSKNDVADWIKTSK